MIGKLDRQQIRATIDKTSFHLMKQHEESSSCTSAGSTCASGAERGYRNRRLVAAVAGVPRAFNRAHRCLRSGTPVPGVKGDALPASADAGSPWFRASGGHD